PPPQQRNLTPPFPPPTFPLMDRPDPSVDLIIPQDAESQEGLRLRICTLDEMETETSLPLSTELVAAHRFFSMFMYVPHQEPFIPT
ncbi:uncharacterized, partial [Tachysurus ichikawai]